MRLSGIVTALAAMPMLAQMTTANIAGTVTDAITHQPIFHAQILRASGPDIVTAEDGSFTVHDVASGDAHFFIRAAGYRQIEDTVHVTPGAVQRQDWELHPMGRLTVRLTDADTGDALGLTVSLRPTTLYATGGATVPTGKKGETTFVNLEAGEYIVDVDGSDSAPDIAKPDSDRTARPKAYAPFSMAETIHLDEAERRTLDLPIHARETFRARVSFEIPRGREGQPVAIRLHNFQSRIPVGSAARPRTGVEIEKLPPGRYAVAAIIGKPADWEYGRVDFEITDRDIDELKLSFRPMANLFGTVRMAEDDVALPANLVAHVMPNDGWSLPMPPFEGVLPLIPIEAGGFHVKGLVPTDFAPTLRDLPDGYAVADVLYGNTPIGDAPFHLEGTGQITFVITSKAGGISGKIDGKHRVLLVPDSFTTRPSGFRIAGADSDANGVFAFRNLAPGKYRIVIMKDQRLDVYAITEQMPEGETVEVRPSETTVIVMHAPGR